ncbi:hypothetical protein [Neobacillus paridis]|uniref:hypothetical protein n=1 Tax=Neobacillus paridis TaxID=2803862 RepID=UPI00192BF2DA|nr:hypothetical protein [Neobacillus paridis]
MSILVVNQNPNFIIQTDDINENAACKYSVQHYTKNIYTSITGNNSVDNRQNIFPFLYASTKNNFICGPINFLIEDLLIHRNTESILGQSEELIKKYNISQETLLETVNKLKSLGLMED